MSYSGYNQFSPYYQSPQQSSQQNHSGPNSGGAYSSNSSFQPLSAYQSEQQRQQQPQQQQQQHQTHNQSSHQSNSNYDSHGYGNTSVTSSAQAALSYGNQSYGGLGSSNGRNNDTSNTYASSRPDTTALGNLAYASSLGPGQQQQQQQQSNLSLSQLIDYNRARSGYPTSGGYGGTSDTSHSHQRVDSQSSNQQPPNGLPHTSTYQTSNTLPAYSSQSYGLNNTGRSSPAQHQYSNSSQQPRVNQAAPRQHNQTPQPARPASGQAMPRPKSQASARGNHPPQVSTARATQPSLGQTAGSHHYGSSAATTGGQQARDNASPAQPRPAQAPPASAHTQSRSSATSATQSNQSRRLSNTQAQTAKQQDTRNPASEPAAGNSGFSAPPVTVNPNQIFNHSEWERRQEEEKAERLARAASAASAATKTPGDDVTQAAKALMSQSASASSESTTKEQIELEMKQMIEKMRDYKAKDPSLFSQVWEEVKKGDAAQRTPQPASSSAKAPAANGLPTPTVELPAESDLAATPSASDFDRGRYPMQRRRRGGSTYTPDRSQKSDKKARAGLLTGNDRETMKDTTVSTPAPPAQQPAPAKTTETPKPSGQKAASPAAGAKLPPAGTTYWPENKKRGLAIAARNALMYPAINHGKNISADEIHALLDRNPSYAQLCEYLEAKGFVIERGPFARTLLAAVPEMGAPNNASTLNQSSPKPAPPPPSRPEVAPPPQPPAAQSHPPSYFAPPFNPALHFSSFQVPSGQPPNGSSGAYAGFNPNVKPEIGPSQPAKPLSKEEKAKKRTFADIVDLSQLSDEDDFVRHRPKPRPEKPPSAMPNGRPPVTGTTNDALSARWRPPGPPKTQLQSPPSVQQPAPSKPMPRQIPHHHMPHLNSREHLLYDLVVDPMNKRRDALRRSSYDPKTIARDILLASGKHPSMPPLNEHLEALRDKFMSVDANSDLSTFRWDLVDPGGDPAPKASARPVEDNEPSLFLSDHELASPTSPAPEVKSRSAVVAVSVEGRSDSPAEPTSQGSLKGKYGRRGRPPKKRFNVSGLGIGEAHPSAAVEGFPATPRADLTTKGPVKQGSLPYTSPYAESTTEANTTFEPALTPSSQGPVPSPEVSGVTPSTGLPKRKGRPPGAKNRAPRSDKGIPKKVSQEFLPTSPRNITPSQIRPDSSKPLRPSGLRNTLTPTKSGIAVVIPSPARSLEPTSPSLRPQVLGKDDALTGTDPSYTVFRCNWANCPAELHDMKILRKHVRKQHRDRVSQVGPWQCKWGDCKSPFERYTDPEEWERHVEQRHLRPYEREIWDGGRKGRSGEFILRSCTCCMAKERQLIKYEYRRRLLGPEPAFPLTVILFAGRTNRIVPSRAAERNDEEGIQWRSRRRTRG